MSSLTKVEEVLARGMLQKKCIITAALTGVAAGKKHCPAIPYTPVEIAEEAKRAYDAGASIVHIHAREDDGKPSHRVEVYGAIMEEVRKRCPVIINFSTGAVDIEKEERIKHITDLKPEIGALNMGSMNYAKYNMNKDRFEFNWVFENSFDTIDFFLSHMRASGVKPELECFDTGHISNILPFIHKNDIQPPFQFSFIMGVLGGIPATAENLAHQVRQLPDGSQWEVIGISHMQWMMVMAAISLGGNVRVGLEDNFYVEAGRMAESNGDLVDKAARLVRDSGRSVATVAEARELLGLAAVPA